MVHMVIVALLITVHAVLAADNELRATAPMVPERHLLEGRTVAGCPKLSPGEKKCCSDGSMFGLRTL